MPYIAPMSAPDLVQPLRSALRWLLRHPLSRGQWAVLVALLIGMAVLELHLGERLIEQTNSDYRRSDQSAYMGLAKASRGDWWPTKTDGTRNPLFVWLVSTVWTEDLQTFFEAGKRFNLRLAVAGAFALGLVFARFLPLLPTVNLAILAGVAVLMPIGTYFGAEPLFYLMFFGYWVCAVALLRRNPLWLYAVAGAFAAATYLAKPSVTLLTGMFVLACAWRWFLSRRAPQIPESVATPGWSGRRLALGALLFAMVYGVIVAPRAVYSQRVFGAPFYSTAGQRFWAENFEEVRPVLGRLNPRRIHEVPPEQRPSFRNYMRKHTVGDFFERLATGAHNQFALLWSGSPQWRSGAESWEDGRPTKPINRLILLRGAYLVALAALSAGMLALTGGWRSLDAAARTATLMVAGLFFVHLLAFGWYAHHAGLPRFGMSLYVPMAFSMAWGAEALRRRLSPEWAHGVYAAVHLAMLATLVARLVTLARFPTFSGLKGVF